MSRPGDFNRVIEACFDGKTRAALLYADNLPAGFFDVSSGLAGDILQKLRNYRMWVAVVCPPGRVQFSTRFGELAAAERRDGHFAVFETRDEAAAWLATRVAP